MPIVNEKGNPDVWDFEFILNIINNSGPSQLFQITKTTFMSRKCLKSKKNNKKNGLTKEDLAE
jgi:hypothetical protein